MFVLSCGNAVLAPEREARTLTTFLLAIVPATHAPNRRFHLADVSLHVLAFFRYFPFSLPRADFLRYFHSDVLAVAIRFQFPMQSIKILN